MASSRPRSPRSRPGRRWAGRPRLPERVETIPAPSPTAQPTGRAPRARPRIYRPGAPARRPLPEARTHLLELTPVRAVGRVPTRHRAQGGHRLGLVAAHPRPHVDRDGDGAGSRSAASAPSAMRARANDSRSGGHQLRMTPSAISPPSRIAFGPSAETQIGTSRPGGSERVTESPSSSSVSPRSRARTRRTVSRSSSSAPVRPRPFPDRGSAGPPSARAPWPHPSR